ncbi:MAG: flagellar filament capping protein FliD [Treponema sp.]|jgi:flagellar hook-associated protein 2|nr:flagellar filament capping protein FliD [Treponema sp.]
MSDIYVPGVKSRFNTEKLIEDLMKVERVPKERVEKNVGVLENEKGYWQEVGRRMNSLRDSARFLYSFQNPFNERIVSSSDESVLSGTATREAREQNYRFTVKQIARADRFLSPPLDDSFKVEAGTYTYRVGKDEISFNFRGGTVREFADALNRRGRDKIAATVVTVQPGSRSLLIESKITGAENRLGFSGDAEKLAVRMGMVEQVYDSRREFRVEDARSAADPSRVSAAEGKLRVGPATAASVPFSPGVAFSPDLVLKFETATAVKSDDDRDVPKPPPGPSVPSSGSVTYGGITVENDLSSAPLPVWTPPEAPKRVDDMAVLSLGFSDGTTAPLPPLTDSADFSVRQYRLGEVAGGKTIVSLDINNRNTHRDISVRNIEVFDPAATGGVKPRNAVSTAQDAILSMEGIEVTRPSNTIDDLIPGVSVTARSPSDRPVSLGIVPDREAVKDAVISLVGNYNRLLAEINVLTRHDDRIIEELSYLTPEEKTEMKKRQGTFMGDSTLNQIKSSMQRAAAAPYPTDAERDLVMLAQIGVGTDVRRSGLGGGYDPSRLRGYLEIDEKALDTAIETKLPAIQQLFGNDTNGDLLADTGVAYMLETLSKPFVETGGIIALKTGTIDSRISQDRRRIESMERQLAVKEQQMRVQYGQMEGAYNRMEQMSNSLNNFSRQNDSNGR